LSILGKYFKNLNFIFLFITVLVVIILFFSPFLKADSEISCGDVITADTVLTSDLNCTTDYGLIINTSNVVLDCNGHEIKSQKSHWEVTTGILISSCGNVTVKNCTLINWYNGIKTMVVNDSDISYINISEGAMGFYLNNTNYTKIENSYANVEAHGYFDYPPYVNHDNYIVNNTIKGQIYDIFIQSCYNYFKNNVGSDNKTIEYYNDTNVTLENKIYSELILCNADNSFLNNITTTNSLILRWTDNATLISVNSSNNYEGIRLDFSGSNQIINSTFKENIYYDIYLWVDENKCNNYFSNVTLSGNYPLGYYNGTNVTLENKIYSELILCNADNSVINNVTIFGSSSKKNNGLLLVRTDNINITGLNSSANQDGIVLIYSNYNKITDSNLSQNDNYGVLLRQNSNNNSIINNSIINNLRGIFLYANSNFNNISDNTVCNNYDNDIYIESNSHNNSGDNICDSLNDKDSNQVTCSMNCTGGTSTTTTTTTSTTTSSTTTTTTTSTTTTTISSGGIKTLNNGIIKFSLNDYGRSSFLGYPLSVNHMFRWEAAIRYNDTVKYFHEFSVKEGTREITGAICNSTESIITDSNIDIKITTILCKNKKWIKQVFEINSSSYLENMTFYQGADLDMEDTVGGERGFYDIANDAVYENQTRDIGFASNQSSYAHHLYVYPNAWDAIQNDAFNNLLVYPSSGTEDVVILEKWSLGNISQGSIKSITIVLAAGDTKIDFLQQLEDGLNKSLSITYPEIDKLATKSEFTDSELYQYNGDIINVPLNKEIKINLTLINRETDDYNVSIYDWYPAGFVLNETTSNLTNGIYNSTSRLIWWNRTLNAGKVMNILYYLNATQKGKYVLPKAKMNSSLFSVNSSNVTVYIGENYNVSINSTERSKIGGWLSNVSFPVIVNNTGDFLDNFQYNLIGLPSNWSTYIPDSVELEPGESKIVWVNITVPDIRENTTKNFILNVSSNKTFDALDFNITGYFIPFYISLNPIQANTSIGGKADHTITIQNNDAGGVFSIDVTGLSEDWYNITNSLYITQGDVVEIPLEISIPENCSNVGTYNFTVNVSNGEDYSIVYGNLTVFSYPIVTNLMPQNNTLSGSDETLIYWETSGNTSSQVFYKEENGNWENVTGPWGTTHHIQINLTHNQNYTWYVRSENICGFSVSKNRTLRIGNGIVFSQRAYTFSVDRDYNQTLSISINNTDNENHTVQLVADESFDDLAYQFLGSGSQEENLTLAPGQETTVLLVVHAPDAERQNYYINIHLTNLGEENITDSALVHLRATWPYINFTLEEISEDPTTLEKTLGIHNYGDTLRDLTIKPEEDLKDKVLILPIVSHTSLSSDSNLDFQVIPIFSENVHNITGNITATAANYTKTIFINITPPAGKDVFKVTLNHPIIYYELSGAWCINQEPIINDFYLPLGLHEENISYAYIGFELNSGGTSPYDVYLYMNENPIGQIINTRPEGYYRFTISPNYLNYPDSGIATNKFKLNTTMPHSYYTPLEKVEVIMCLSGLDRYVVATNQTEANGIAWNASFLYRPHENISVYVLSPTGNVTEGQETIIRAEVLRGDGQREKYANVSAYINSQEVILVDNGEHSDNQRNDGIYAYEWTPNSTGSVDLNITACNCLTTSYNSTTQTVVTTTTTSTTTTSSTTTTTSGGGGGSSGGSTASEETTTTIVPSGLPDLVVKKIKFSPSALQNGQPVNVSVIVKNIGDAPIEVDGYIEVTFYINNSFNHNPTRLTSQGIIIKEPLGVGEEVETDPVEWTAVPIYNEFTDNFFVEVELHGGQNEMNENNNILTTNIPIYEGGFSIYPDSYSFENFRRGPNGKTIKAVLGGAVRNIISDTIGLGPLVTEIIGEFEGHCYGMASTSVLYYRGTISRPLNKKTIEMKLEDPGVYENIVTYFGRQAHSIVVTLFKSIWDKYAKGLDEVYYRDLKNKGEMVLGFKIRSEHIISIKEVGIQVLKAGHAVTVFDTYDVSPDIKNVVIYDNNYPGEAHIIQFNLSSNKAMSLDSTGRELYGEILNPHASGPWGHMATLEETIRNTIQDLSNYFGDLVKDGGNVIISVAESAVEIGEDVIDGIVDVISFWSPVNVTITDEYGRIINEEINDIPGAKFENIDGKKVFYIPSNLKYTANIAAYEDGEVSVERIKSTSGDVLDVAETEPMEISKDMRGSIDFDKDSSDFTFKADENNDGVFEKEIKPRIKKENVTEISSVGRVYIIDENGRILSKETNQIDGAYVESIGNANIFFIPPGLNYSTKVEGNRKGSLAITRIVSDGKGGIKSTYAENISINSQTKGTLIPKEESKFYGEFDFNGDGLKDKDITGYVVYSQKKNEIPKASFTVSKERAEVKEEIIFDASNSIDPDGENFYYEWDMGDGNKEEGERISHTYEKPGNYLVILKVSDENGLSDFDQMPIYIESKHKETKKESTFLIFVAPFIIAIFLILIVVFRRRKISPKIKLPPKAKTIKKTEAIPPEIKEPKTEVIELPEENKKVEEEAEERIPIPATIHEILFNKEKYLNKEVKIEGVVAFIKKYKKTGDVWYIIKDGTGKFLGLSKEEYSGRGVIVGRVKKENGDFYIEF